MVIFGPFGAFFVLAWKPVWMLRALLSMEDGTFHADGLTELLIIFAKPKKQSQNNNKVRTQLDNGACVWLVYLSHIPLTYCRTMTDLWMAVGASIWVKGSCVMNNCELH
jgi:hypothetical protein